MATDIIARGMAAGAKKYAQDAIAALPNGLVYRGQVNYYSDLPTSGVEVGDCYTVKYAGSSGSVPSGVEYVWGPDGGVNTWIEIGPDMSQYQPLLVSGSNIKSINGASILGSGDMRIATSQEFPQSWPTTGTTKAFCNAVNADPLAVQGMSFLGEVTWSDFPSGIANAEVVVQIMSGTGTNNKVIHLVLTSGNVAPYRWEYTYWNNGSNVSGWIAFATDASVVKLSGAQTISGQKTFSGNVVVQGNVSDGTTSIPVAKMENTDNKTSSITADSTETEYPSAAATYGFVESQFGVVNISQVMSAQRSGSFNTINEGYGFAGYCSIGSEGYLYVPLHDYVETYPYFIYQVGRCSGDWCHLCPNGVQQSSGAVELNKDGKAYCIDLRDIDTANLVFCATMIGPEGTSVNGMSFGRAYLSTNRLVVDAYHYTDARVAPAELTKNKTQVINDSVTALQYPSAVAVSNFVNEGVPYLTTAPVADNTNGKLKIVVLNSEPETKYDGYLYIIVDNSGTYDYDVDGTTLSISNVAPDHISTTGTVMRIL